MIFQNEIKPVKTLLVIACLSLFQHIALAQTDEAAERQIFLADPTIVYTDSTYYLYGTGEGGANNGFKVFTSVDAKQWKDNGYALKKGDAFGEKGFWAPQVFSFHNQYYIIYVANEQIAIAESNSPLGPFTQKIIGPLSAPVKQIDPFVFFDDDGKKYLYHVRLQKGNRIFVAELKNELSDIKPETLKECITATQPWENTASSPWPVTEGPTVLKHKGLYYLFYSANDFRNPDYAVGYAISKRPYGPWKKYRHNPILSKKQTGYNGSGHGDFFVGDSGKLYYVYHTHYSSTVVAKRKTALVEVHFKKRLFGKDKVEVNPKSSYYLQLQNLKQEDHASSSQ